MASCGRVRRVKSPSRGRCCLPPGRLLDTGQRAKLEVKAGDAALFAKYAGTELKLDAEDYLVIRESDLLAVVDGESTS